MSLLAQHHNSQSRNHNNNRQNYSQVAGVAGSRRQGRLIVADGFIATVPIIAGVGIRAARGGNVRIVDIFAGVVRIDGLVGVVGIIGITGVDRRGIIAVVFNDN